MSNPYEQLLNQILEAMLPKINGAIGGEIRNKHLDPLKNVASGSKGFGIGTAHYAVHNLSGLSSLDIKELHISNVTGEPENLSGNVAINVALNSSLSAAVSGDVKILFADPGISGKISISGASVAGGGSFGASVEGEKICLNKINLTSTNFNYSSANISLDLPGIIDSILKPLENLILDAVKGDIRSLVSSQIKGILNDQIGNILPQCTDT